MFAFLEGLVALVEMFTAIAEGVLWFVDGLSFICDIYAWIRGRPNRIARKEARKTGADIPPRDRWNRRVITFTLLILLVTAVLVILRFSSADRANSLPIPSQP